MPDLDFQNNYVFFGIILGGCLLGLLILSALIGIFGGKRKETKSNVNELAINLSALELDEIVAAEQLLLYGIPMRLVTLVLAPSGHAVKFPARDDLPANIERLIPGLPDLLNSHHPIFRQWPAQMSIEGFKRSFFQNVPLPGDEGKGTRWCGVVGPFESKQGRLLAGLILLSAEENGYGQIEIEHEGQWHQAIQIKS